MHCSRLRTTAFGNCSWPSQADKSRDRIAIGKGASGACLAQTERLAKRERGARRAPRNRNPQRNESFAGRLSRRSPTDDGRRPTGLLPILKSELRTAIEILLLLRFSARKSYRVMKERLRQHRRSRTTVIFTRDRSLTQRKREQVRERVRERVSERSRELDGEVDGGGDKAGRRQK